MTVVDDLKLLAKLLPPSLSARYRVQLLWAADVNKDIGFNFSLRKLPNCNEENRDDVELQFRDFNLANFNQSSAAATTCALNAEESIFTPESQQPNPGSLDTEIKHPEVMIGSGGETQGFIARPSGRKKEKIKCDECSWEGSRDAYGGHVRRVHGKKPNLTRCEKCGLKCYSLWLASHKCADMCRRQLQDGHQRKRPKRKGARRNEGGTCGTCGLETSDLMSHVLSRHTNKEQYLEEHYKNTSKDEELKRGYNCHICGKHFPTKTPLWRHVSRVHGVVTIEEIRKVAMGKNVVEDKSLEKDQTMTELELVESNMFTSTPAAVVEEQHHSGDEEKAEEKGECSNVEGKGLDVAEEKQTELEFVESGEMRSSKRKRERKALREASPACDYERIRAANIAERMELLRTLDIEGAVASVKERFS